MKQYQLFRQEEVYVDFQITRTKPGAQVGLDTRQGLQSVTGSRPIGARHEQWQELFHTAMREASYMIFVVTEEFRASQWCRIEWGLMIHENLRRRSRT